MRRLLKTQQNISAVHGIVPQWMPFLSWQGENQCRCAVLNFASAKNPGGGFINGAMAQEESLAASSCLYKTLTAHETYYRMNRACSTMIYTDHAIFSPDVVFFRDGRFGLLRNLWKRLCSPFRLSIWGR
ncbi:MAG: TIGR02452 family protein [Enterocloster sp.]